jgi:pyrophosphate--fructose-6-phosphate 1-phosphotransferase
MVAEKLAIKKENGTYTGKFSPVHHYFGYEGRCAFPSNFDADYCYSLGYNAFVLIQYGYNGYLSKISNLANPAEDWIAGGMPITKMMNIERRHGKDKPVIKKALVDLKGEPFKLFKENREKWAIETSYIYPGAIQYYGPAEVCDRTTITLSLESNNKKKI